MAAALAAHTTNDIGQATQGHHGHHAPRGHTSIAGAVTPSFSDLKPAVTVACRPWGKLNSFKVHFNFTPGLEIPKRVTTYQSVSRETGPTDRASRTAKDRSA